MGSVQDLIQVASGLVVPSVLSQAQSEEFVKFLTLKTPYALNAALFLYCLNIAVLQFENTRNGNAFHGAVYTVLSAFGGGIIVPVLVGHDGYYPFPLANDLALSLIVSAYFLMRRSPALRDFVGRSHAQLVVVVGFEAARCLMLLNWLQVAHATIPPSYFKVPIVGPIICGTIGGCGGAFLPFEKGLNAIKQGPPYAMLSAFVAALIFHTTVHIAPVYNSRYALHESQAHVIVVLGLCGIQLFCWAHGYKLFANNNAGSAHMASWKRKIHQIAWQGRDPFTEETRHRTPSKLKGHYRKDQ
eukprot:g2565.t1